LALIYTTIIPMGECGGNKLSDKANSIKWKILQINIYQGRLPKETSKA
jgi:hypothetical protein